MSIDTAAIRAAWGNSVCGERGCSDVHCEVMVIHRLCDAVDELRAEADERPTWEQHRIWQDALRRENERRKAFEAEAREYRNAICWDTTCLSCSKVLDSAYVQTVRAESAEAKLAKVRAVRDWMGQNNQDAAYDLAIVSLNVALGDGDG